MKIYNILTDMFPLILEVNNLWSTKNGTIKHKKRKYLQIVQNNYVDIGQHSTIDD